MALSPVAPPRPARALAPPALSPAAPPVLRGPPPPLRGGPRAFLRFARRNGMLNLRYGRMLARWAWLKLRWRGRLESDGLFFVGRGVRLEIGREGRLALGRWSCLGAGTKIRVHEGRVEIGAKTVLGEDCTLTAFQSILIGRECILADRTMLLDFDHGMVEVERPVRAQGIYKRDVRVGHNVWVGFGACFLRGVTVGDNAVVGTLSVVCADLPADAVCAGSPARVVRMREAPERMRWA